MYEIKYAASKADLNARFQTIRTSDRIHAFQTAQQIAYELSLADPTYMVSVYQYGATGYPVKILTLCK